MIRALVLVLALVLLPALAAAADDPLELLWSDRLDFAADGSPLITVRIQEDASEISMVTRGAARISAGGLQSRPGSTWRFRVEGAVPAKVRWAAQVADFRLRDREAAEAALATWRERGFAARAVTVGGVFGFQGRVIDNRRYAILLSEPGTRAAAERMARDAEARFGATTQLFEELLERPSGKIVVLDAEGRVAASAPGVVVVEPRDAAGITLLQVEHDMGYAAHGRQDRTYRGKVFVTVDARGKTAAVGVLPMEELVQGIVPSEIFASAPTEALAAQAVAARGEVLAKIGVRHRADPWLICAEQHCQVYKGLSGEHPRTNAAIAASRGEVLFGEGGGLVDSVYSSTCGGHTENNEVVWGTPPDPNLRGVPDWIDHPELERYAARVEDVKGFLEAEVPGVCRDASFSRPEKYRWERRFTRVELESLLRPLGVGAIVSLRAEGRGVSGRATRLVVEGTKGRREVTGELAIRRLLRNLNSSLFVIEPEGAPPTAWTFRGGGWGHGVGMCQMGAIGRAERGHDHEAILRHYYSGAETVRLY
ncbi:MAG TPA: SpoIID/LytB domain-containing protein [Vulgatibacter sp.]|nr:SpoIID/LytB domain-containing protein [Vulgatibacter sp.]